MSRAHLFEVARSKLGMIQRNFGPAVGVSHRTAARWAQGTALPDDPTCIRLAHLIYPIDPQLAEQAAMHVAETLESLGIVPPTPPPPAQPPPPAVELQPAPMPAVLEPPPPTPITLTKPHDLADIVLCAVANANGVVPNTLRPLLYIAFKRARGSRSHGRTSGTGICSGGGTAPGRWPADRDEGAPVTIAVPDTFC